MHFDIGQIAGKPTVKAVQRASELGRLRHTLPARHQQVFPHLQAGEDAPPSRLYELATLSIARGTGSRVAEGVLAFAAGAPDGALLGCWVPEIAPLNTFVVLRGFADDAALSRERERTMLSSSPFGSGDCLVRMALDSYAPFPWLPPVAPGSYGPFYEIRSYVVRPGGIGPILSAWQERLPLRTQYSPLLVVLYALHGTTRITHIWPYPTLAARVEARSTSIQSGAWPPDTGTWITAEMRSGIYLPASGSPLR